MRQSPSVLALRQIDLLLGHLPGIRDADVEHVHDARVATRRLRELLPLVAVETGSSTRQAFELARAMGRALGAVRDLDVLVALCHQLGDTQPHAAGVLAVRRSLLVRQRERAARRLIKRLESLDIESLRTEVRAPHWTLFPDDRPWHTALAEGIATRVAKLGTAVEYASGVYLPNRLHKVRIHLKRLRYLVEIAAETDVWRPARLRRHAALVQDMLGDIHDRQVMLDLLEPTETDATVAAALRADIAQRHREYLAQRDRVRAMVDACKRFVEHDGHRRRRVVSGAAAALLVPVAGAVLMRPSTRPRRDAA